MIQEANDDHLLRHRGAAQTLYRGTGSLPDWELVWKKTYELSQAYSAITGCRTLDTLHVAVALSSGFRHFATSDKRQRELADRVGLCVLDPTHAE